MPLNFSGVKSSSSPRNRYREHNTPNNVFFLGFSFLHSDSIMVITLMVRFRVCTWCQKCKRSRSRFFLYVGNNNRPDWYWESTVILRRWLHLHKLGYLITSGSLVFCISIHAPVKLILFHIFHKSKFKINMWRNFSVYH